MHEVLDKQPVLWLAHTQSSGNEMSDHDSVSASDNDSEYLPDTDSLSYSSSDTMGESVSDSCEESDNFQAEIDQSRFLEHTAEVQSPTCVSGSPNTTRIAIGTSSTGMPFGGSQVVSSVEVSGHPTSAAIVRIDTCSAVSGDYRLYPVS